MMVLKPREPIPTETWIKNPCNFLSFSFLQHSAICQIYGYWISAGITSVTLFKAAACGCVTHACVSSDRAPRCWRIFTCAPGSSSQLTSFITRSPGHEENITTNNESHQHCKWKGETYLSLEVYLFSFLLLLSAALNLIFTCGQDTSNWAYKAELLMVRWRRRRKNQGGYLQLSWHSKSEDGGDCSSANWRHIWEISCPEPNGFWLTTAILVQEGPPVAGSGMKEPELHASVLLLSFLFFFFLLCVSNMMKSTHLWVSGVP